MDLAGNGQPPFFSKEKCKNMQTCVCILSGCLYDRKEGWGEMPEGEEEKASALACRCISASTGSSSTREPSSGWTLQGGSGPVFLFIFL